MRTQFSDYVAVLCRIGSKDEVMAVVDTGRNKEDIAKQIEKEYPGWKVKLINKLYDEDFEEGYR